MTARALLACAFLAASSPLLAQDTPFTLSSGSRPLLRTDGTYVFNHAPNSHLVFEAQIAPRIIILDSIGRATRRVLNEKRTPVWGWQLSTTPMVRLRMFSEVSSPVRTPSYMPKGTFQLARMRNLSSADIDDEEMFNRGPVEMWLADIIPFGHHSNGQNGCLYLEQVRDADGKCLSDVPIELQTVNKTDGSFSTNYIESTLHYGRLYLDARGAPAGEYTTRSEWRLGAGFQLNPGGFAGGSIDDELAVRYGKTRLIVEGMAAWRDAWRCGRLEASARSQYILNAPKDIPPVTVLVEGACHPARWGGAGLFVRAYRGQDYYNLGFAESISRLQFGVVLQRSTFLSFKLRSL